MIHVFGYELTELSRVLIYSTFLHVKKILHLVLFTGHDPKSKFCQPIFFQTSHIRNLLTCILSAFCGHETSCTPIRL